MKLVRVKPSIETQGSQVLSCSSLKVSVELGVFVAVPKARPYPPIPRHGYECWDEDKVLDRKGRMKA